MAKLADLKIETEAPLSFPSERPLPPAKCKVAWRGGASVEVTWDSRVGLDHDPRWIEIWGGTGNDVARACLLAYVRELSVGSFIFLGAPYPFFFWLRVRDVFGDVSVFAPENPHGGLYVMPEDGC